MGYVVAWEATFQDRDKVYSKMWLSSFLGSTPNLTAKANGFFLLIESLAIILVQNIKYSLDDSINTALNSVFFHAFLRAVFGLVI